MNNNMPFMPGFWEEYQKLMQSTLAQTTKILNNLHNYTGSIADKTAVNIGGLTDWGAGGRGSPDIRLDDRNITIAFPLNGPLDISNTRVFLEGCYLIVEGSIQARVPLPMAVQKYGGKAVAKSGVLEIILPRDKFAARQPIPLETL